MDVGVAMDVLLVCGSVRSKRGVVSGFWHGRWRWRWRLGLGWMDLVVIPVLSELIFTVLRVKILY